MIKTFFSSLVICFLLVLQTKAQPGITVGSPYNDAGLAMCLTPDNGYFLTGRTRISNSTSDDMFIIKLNQTGNILWQNTLGWKHQDLIRSVIPLPDGYLMAGAGDAWEGGMWNLDINLVKTDLHGNLIWRQQIGTNSRDIAFDLIPSGENGFIVLGHTRGYDPGDLILIKTNNMGEEVWRQHYGSEYDDYGFEVLENSDGTLLIVGTQGGFFNDVHANYRNHDADILLLKVDKSGNEIWRKIYGGDEHDFGQAILAAGMEGYFLLGSTQSKGLGSFDIVLMRISNTGEVVWEKTYGGKQYDLAASMSINENNDVFILGTSGTGQSGTDGDFFLLNTDTLGEVQWELTFGSEENELGHQVVATPDGGCALMGETEGYGSGMSDMIFVKIDKDGLIEDLTNTTEPGIDLSAGVYPNPVRQRARVKITNPGAKSRYTITLFDMAGKQIYSSDLLPPFYEFKVQSLSQGLYLYRIISEDSMLQSYKGKLLVQ